jgi:hypothetical protein
MYFFTLEGGSIMPVLLRQTSTYITAAVIISVLLSFLFFDDFSLLSMINSVSIISLCFLIIGGFMFTSRGGFFDAITLSFRRVSNRLSKRRQILQDDLDTMALPSDFFGYNITMAFLISGSILFVLSFVLSLVI